jgi:hypothetical protein
VGPGPTFAKNMFKSNNPVIKEKRKFSLVIRHIPSTLTLKGISARLIPTAVKTFFTLFLE